MTKTKVLGLAKSEQRSTTTERVSKLTPAHAKKLLVEKNAKYGRDVYAYAGVVEQGKFSYALARRHKGTGGFRATPTIFWYDGGILRPCTRKIHADKRTRVLNGLRENGVTFA